MQYSSQVMHSTNIACDSLASFRSCYNVIESNTSLKLSALQILHQIIIFDKLTACNIYREIWTSPWDKKIANIRPQRKVTCEWRISLKYLKFYFLVCTEENHDSIWDRENKFLLWILFCCGKRTKRCIETLDTAWNQQRCNSGLFSFKTFVILEKIKKVNSKKLFWTKKYNNSVIGLSYKSNAA